MAKDTESGTPVGAQLRTLLICDLVESTALVERMGDLAAAELIRKHDRLARTLVDRHAGREIDKTDGFLLMFERPVQAAAFALDYQRALRQFNAAESVNLAARVGIHVGDVVVWENSAEDVARGAKPVEVEGLVKPVASRLMTLAFPGQVLLSNIAYALAHRAQGELGERLEKVRWRTHGRYRFRGVPDPVPVFEVGEEGLAPLKAPPWSSKAHREVPFWRRPATVVIEALVVLALLTIPLYMFLRPQAAIAFAERDWVVVGSLHNLTGETVFDDSLESALRIGLEQSHFVNVLSDLKVRDTLTRMQLDPATAEVSRAVGSEVAIRDGARALILPTIAEIGGRVRITAEVIDPQTQTTVYSETADGIGKESILPSLDVINQRLRVRLGEALATVSAESKPLEKVATENLEALRAYSLGVNKYASGQFPEALELFRQALQLDAGFASVQVRIGAIRASSGQQEQAVESFSRALEQSERLTTRDALYAEAMRASAQQAPDALVKWATLTERFPDYFTGLGSFAYLNWRDANRFDAKAMAMVEASASSKNPNRMPSLQLMGILELGNGRFAQALAHFADAEAQGLQFTEYHAATQAAMRKFDEAKATLARSPAGAAKGNPAMAITRASLNAALLVDQGKLEQASTLLDEAARAETDGKVLAQAFSIMRLTLISADPPLSGDDLRSAKQQLEDVLAQRKSAQTARRQTLDAQALILAYLLARANERDLARRVLAAIPLADMPSGSSNAKLRSVVEAELDRIEGRHGAGIQRLETLLDGSELFITHVALLDAYAAAGQAGKALQQARWLSGHRGRAYAEVAPDNRLTAFNVQHTTLALLQAAELAVAQKDKDSARAMLKQFLEAWPEASARPALAKRIRALQGVLSEPGSP